ncbi:MAG: hypothetical protein P0S94_01525, partial [Simkaniaceae bacterium]|nr:hypothetical protein [Simkaniaceae bacterium]
IEPIEVNFSDFLGSTAAQAEKEFTRDLNSVIASKNLFINRQVFEGDVTYFKAFLDAAQGYFRSTLHQLAWKANQTQKDLHPFALRFPGSLIEVFRHAAFGKTCETLLERINPSSDPRCNPPDLWAVISQRITDYLYPQENDSADDTAQMPKFNLRQKKTSYHLDYVFKERFDLKQRIVFEISSTDQSHRIKWISATGKFDLLNEKVTWTFKAVHNNDQS